MPAALDKLAGPAAPLMIANINTDLIAPMYSPGSAGKPRAMGMSLDGMAHMLFANWRYDKDEREIPDFILNREPFRHARFIVAGPNFGCGSSRDSAPNMLSAFGIRCVIAAGFGEIFRDNCFKIAVLPLSLDEATVRELGQEAADGSDFNLDVAAQILRTPSGRAISFELPAFRREQLLSGLDDVALTMRRADDIASYQQRERAARPWTFLHR